MSRQNWRLPVGTFVVAVLLSLIGLSRAPSLTGVGGPGGAAAAGALDGSKAECDPWLRLAIGDNDWEIAEEGWVWVNGSATTDKFRDASGVVTKSKVAHNDLPENHFSHDWNVEIRVDPGQEGLVSTGNDAGRIEMEWETGVRPNETSGDGADPFIPRWVFPNLGDRVWVNGHWVFDCGHGEEIGGSSATHYKSEIHPARAIASMRSQFQTLPHSGTTPVPVTAVDLYIHGRGGYMVQQLECGADILLFPYPFSTCDVTDTRIDDLYTFGICLPPQPRPWAVLEWTTARGPDDDGFEGNLDIQSIPASEACQQPADEFGNDFDDNTMLQVQINLQGSGITPEDVYSRKIVAGWVYPPATPLPHLSLKLDKLDLHEDHEADPFDAEMTFWWMGVDRAPNDEWYRLVNFEIPTFEDVQFPCPNHTNTLDTMDDDGGCGNGELNFAGPVWDFYADPDRGFEIHTTGFEQDCFDNHFGSASVFGYLGLVTVLARFPACYFGALFELANDWGNNDAIANIHHSITSPLSVLGSLKSSATSEYDLYFTLSQIPAAEEDKADLGVSKTCSWAGEVAQAGSPFTCTIVVRNFGPGLPRSVVVEDTITSSLAASDYTVGSASFIVGAGPTSYPCGASSASGFSCEIGTVPVGGSVTITVEISPLKAGSFTNSASLSTVSTDEVSANDASAVGVDVHRSASVDIQPGSTQNAVNLSKKGLVTVALLRTADFNPVAAGVTGACFGDAEDASQRTCVEVHGGPHAVDVNKDKLLDLVFHFGALATGIDMGDATACIKGMTADGIGFYGCDRVTPVP
jgi:hypothetical protein